MIHSGAIIDPTEVYRYSLWREWDSQLGRVVFVMLNPSAADAARDDPTLRRCIGFARSWGYGSLEVVNLFAYRAVKPSMLRQAEDPVGPENQVYLESALQRADLLLAAWGNHGLFRSRGQEAARILEARGEIHCLGLTRTGQPRHPLHSSGKLQPVPYTRVVRGHDSSIPWERKRD